MRGFTIVELLIVIVIIGILASITIVAFNGIQQRSRNSARMTVGNQWVSVFQVYQALNDQMPPSAAAMAVNAKFCLGTGFPVGGGGVPRCQNVNGTDSNSPAESDSAALMTELATVGNLPATKPTRTLVTGPYLQRISSTTYWVVIGVEGTYTVGADCGGGYIVAFASGNGATCRKAI